MNEVKVLSVEEEAQVNGGFPPIFYAVVAIAGHLARNPVVRRTANRIGLVGATSYAANWAYDRTVGRIRQSTSP